jgi:hypothetical protein
MLPQPIITPHDGSDHIWRLVGNYQATSMGVRVEVEAGFLFDGASIPRLFWRVIGHPMMGRPLPAVVIHDALYASHLTDREMADKMFLDLLARNAVPWVKRWTMFYAVRACGGLAWNRGSGEIKAAREFVRARKDVAA